MPPKQKDPAPRNFRTAVRKKVKARELPELPEFQPMIQPCMDFHSRSITPNMKADVGSPGAILNESISMEQIAIMARNTNEYAGFQKALKWKDTTVDELSIFIALLIFMGIYSFPYWKKDFELPIMEYVSLNRFQQVKVIQAVRTGQEPSMRRAAEVYAVPYSTLRGRMILKRKRKDEAHGVAETITS